MRIAFLVLAAALAGCSTDASGLGDEIVLGDATTDTTSGGSETNPLFPDEDGSVAVDSGTPVETDSAAPDSSVAPDTEVPDTSVAPDTEVPDTSVASDTEVPDTAMADTAVVDSGSPPADSTPADTSTAPSDTGSDSGVTSVPGRVSCGSTMCATGLNCCESSGALSCKDTCNFGSSVYRCDEKSDCATGQVCCASYALFTTTWNGSFCVGADYCYTATACRTNADCSGGKVCTPGPSGAPSSFASCR